MEISGQGPVRSAKLEAIDGDFLKISLASLKKPISLSRERVLSFKLVGDDGTGKQPQTTFGARSRSDYVFTIWGGANVSTKGAYTKDLGTSPAALPGFGLQAKAPQRLPWFRNHAIIVTAGLLSQYEGSFQGSVFRERRFFSLFGLEWKFSEKIYFAAVAGAGITVVSRSGQNYSGFGGYVGGQISYIPIRYGQVTFTAFLSYLAHFQNAKYSDRDGSSNNTIHVMPGISVAYNL